MLILSKLNFCTYYQIDKKSPKNDQINQIYSQLIVKLLEYKSWQHPIQVPYHDARITSSTPAGPHALHVSKDKVLHYMAPPNQVFLLTPISHRLPSHLCHSWNQSGSRDFSERKNKHENMA